MAAAVKDKYNNTTSGAITVGQQAACSINHIRYSRRPSKPSRGTCRLIQETPKVHLPLSNITIARKTHLTTICYSQI